MIIYEYNLSLLRKTIERTATTTVTAKTWGISRYIFAVCKMLPKEFSGLQITSAATPDFQANPIAVRQEEIRFGIINGSLILKKTFKGLNL